MIQRQRQKRSVALARPLSVPERLPRRPRVEASDPFGLCVPCLALELRVTRNLGSLQTLTQNHPRTRSGTSTRAWPKAQL